MNELLEKINSYPDLLSVRDLVSLGLFASHDRAYDARAKGTSPDYIKMHHKILYPRDSLISFLKSRFKKGDKKATTNEPTTT